MPPIRDFDDMFPHVGGFGKYQKTLVLLFLPFNMFYVFVWYTQMFMEISPEHWCLTPELDQFEELSWMQKRNLSIPTTEKDGKDVFSKCEVYDVNYTKLIQEGVTHANESWPTIKCTNGWHYEYGQYYPTIVSDFDWVCDENWKGAFAQSMFFVGAIFGSILFGWLADKFGRLPTLISANMVAFVAGVATPFAPNFYAYAAIRFVCGFSFDNLYCMMYIIVLEYVTAEKRSLVANLPLAFAMTLSLSALPWIAYGIGNWKILAISTSIPMGFVIFGPWLIPESGRWLMAEKKVDRLDKVMRNVAKRNGKQVPEEIFLEFRKLVGKAPPADEKKEGVLDLFKCASLRNRMFLMITVWMITALCFDGHMRNLNNLPFNMFITFTIASSMELPADTVPVFILDTLGRRWSCMLSMVLSGLCYLVVIFLPRDELMATLVMALAGRFFISVTFNCGLQYCVEMIPTRLRGQGINLIHISGHFATLFSPIVVYLGNVSVVLPFLILGGLSIVGGFLALLLPETANASLPETAAAAKEFGLDQRFMYMPFMDPKVEMDEEDMQEMFRRASQNTINIPQTIRRASVAAAVAISRRASVVPGYAAGGLAAQRKSTASFHPGINDFLEDPRIQKLAMNVPGAPADHHAMNNFRKASTAKKVFREMHTQVDMVAEEEEEKTRENSLTGTPTSPASPASPTVTFNFTKNESNKQQNATSKHGGHHKGHDNHAYEASHEEINAALSSMKEATEPASVTVTLSQHSKL